MAKAALAWVTRRARRDEFAALSDKELMRLFADLADQAAFAALVRRHTAMVHGVCKRALPSEADAEDACQAVFLVLAKKAGSTRWQASVAGWLYTTARRVARNVRVTAARRARHEGAAAVAESITPGDVLTARELVELLDEELGKLPPRHREPLVLCYLEGLTRDEAATRLGVEASALKGLLERGRKKLAYALTARGCAVGVALLATATSSAGASPPRLVQLILATVGGKPSATVAALAQEVAVNGILNQVKWIMLAVASVALLGIGFAARPQAEAKSADAPKAVAELAVVSGRVVGSDGQPVVAALSLLRMEGAPLPVGKSSADGTFRVAVPSTYHQLVARVGGQGVGYAFVSGGGSGVTLRLTKDNAVRGRVLDTQGKPVAGALVFPRWVYDFGRAGATPYIDFVKTRPPFSGSLEGEHNLYLSPRSEFDGSLLSAKTDANGHFEILGLGEERVVGLYCRAAGLADCEAVVVNRARFDAAEANKAAADTRERMMPKDYKLTKHEKPLSGPDAVVLVAEREKVIRGVVKDRDSGRPRPGVTVTVARVSGREILSVAHTATTDREGRFVIRGSRKYSAYVAEVAADVDSGHLPATVEAKDTAGHAPIDVEILCARGVVVKGKMTDKATGRPLSGAVTAEPMQENPHLAKFPTLGKGYSGSRQQVVTGDDGSFRFVTLPGPVLVMAGLRVAQHEAKYVGPKADPKYPHYFHNRFGRLGYYTTRGGLSNVRGCWCKVIDLEPTANGLTLNVELEPASRKSARVVGPDGKPVKSCEATNVAAGWEGYPIPEESDKVFVYGMEPKGQRFVVVSHQPTRMVGAAVIREDDADPVVTLGAGGVVTGRAVGVDGKPLAGVTVEARFDHPSVEGAYMLLQGRKRSVTDADGRFRLEGLVPGHGFRLVFSKGPKYYGPRLDAATKHVIDKHGGELKLGDVKAAPRDG